MDPGRVGAASRSRCRIYEGVAAFLHCGEVSDALLKLREAHQPREEAGCAEMWGAPVTRGRGIPAIHP